VLGRPGNFNRGARWRKLDGVVQQIGQGQGCRGTGDPDGQIRARLCGQGDAAILGRRGDTLDARLHKLNDRHRFQHVLVLASIQARKHQQFFHHLREPSDFFHARVQGLDVFFAAALAPQRDLKLGT